MAFCWHALGTFDNGRESMTITVPRVDARTVGALIALIESHVGLYARLIGINAIINPASRPARKRPQRSWICKEGRFQSFPKRPRPPKKSHRREGAGGHRDSLLVLEHLAANGRPTPTELARQQMTFFTALAL